jgi:hypothetical protein
MRLRANGKSYQFKDNIVIFTGAACFLFTLPLSYEYIFGNDTPIRYAGNRVKQTR